MTSLVRLLLALGWGHVDAGNRERVAVDRALHGDMMTGVGCHFVLVSDRVHFLVRIVHERELSAFLHALRGALGRAFVSSFRAAFAVRYVAGPTAVACDRQCAGKKRDD